MSKQQRGFFSRPKDEVNSYGSKKRQSNTPAITHNYTENVSKNNIRVTTTSTTTTTTTILITTSTTTTTTTNCYRPDSLITLPFRNKLRDLNTQSIIDFSTSLMLACNSLETFSKYPLSYILMGEVVQVRMLKVGEKVYNGLESDCTTISNGYYVTDVYDRQIAYVSDGIIQSINICPTK
jgi:hypothetical protein